MLIFLAFLFLLTPFPTLRASAGERKNSTKTAPHIITSLNIKQKTPTLSPASKISNVSHSLFSTMMPPEIPIIKKTSKDKPPSRSPIKVVITEGCIQKEPQKDTVNSSKVQETELSLKPGSPLVMTHHISLVPGSCTGGCEVEMTALKERVEILEKEMSALKKKCTDCPGVQCPNNCNKNGKCINGKCVHHAGFSGTDCSKGVYKEIKVSRNTSTVKQETSSQEQLKANITIMNSKDKKERHQDQSRGRATVEKIPLSKELPLNYNVTQSTEKKANGTLKVLIKLSKGIKESANVTVTSPEKGNLSLSNVTSTDNDKKPFQDSVIKVVKGGASVIQKVEKQANATEELKGRDKKQHKGHEKNLLVKYLNVTMSSEKDKKPIKESVILFKEGSSDKKIVEKLSKVTSSIEKDKKPTVTILKEGSYGKKIVEKLSNVTSSIEKDKKPTVTILKEGSSGKTILEKLSNVSTFIVKDKKPTVTISKEGLSDKKMVGKLSNVTSSIEKDKKPTVTFFKEGSSDKKIVEKLSNVTSSIEKGKKPTVTILKEGASDKKIEEKLSNVTSTIEKVKKPLVTILKEGSFDKKMVEKLSNVTSSIEKVKKPPVMILKEGPSDKKMVEKLSNVTCSTEKNKKPTVMLKEGSSDKKIVEKLSNVTSSIEKVKKPPVTILKEGSFDKKMVEKLSNVTSSIEKVKKPPVMVLKEGSSEKKMMEKLSNVTTFIVKDRTLHQNNNLPKDGSSGKRKVERFLNATATNIKDQKLPEDDEKKKTSRNRNMETHVNVTTSSEKDRKLNLGNITPLKEASLGKTKVERHLNVTNFTEKERKNHSNVTPLKPSPGMRNVTTSSEKRKKLVAENKIKVFKVTLEKKAAQKRVNVTTSTGKYNKLHQGITDKSSKKTKLESHFTETASSEKEKTLLQNNETKVLNDVTVEKKRVDKHLNVTTVTEKDKKIYKSNSTLSKESSSSTQKGKVDNVNVKKPSEKSKKFLQGDETAVLTKVISVTEEKNRNATTTSEEDKSLHHSFKEDESRKNKVNSDFKNITISKTYVNRTTKLVDIGPVEIHNITATGFVMTWVAPQELFRNFTVTRREVWSGRSSEDDAEEAEKSTDGDIRADELYSSNSSNSLDKFSQILAGSARCYHFKNLRPQRKYSVSLFSSGPHARSKVHRLFVSTGPEPPTELLFSNITETSLTVSWTKPESTVIGFKVTYTNSENGLTGSMFVDSQLSHVLISKLSVGSQYEISVRSVMEAIESEATTASVVTVPDSPTDLQAVNVTDSKALLIWKHAQAKVNHYILIISYGSTRSPNVTVTVMLSGTSVEHQLRGLYRSTLYEVKILSQINSLQSSAVSTTFTTKSGVKIQVVTPSQVTCNSALISWKTTHISFRSYRLTYQFREEVNEVILNPTVSQYELTDLVASTHYTVKVDGKSEGQYISVVSTSFTTAQLPYPYPAECSQVQLNGMKNSGEAEIYPEGKDGESAWVYCDMETDGGGWTVFQRRVDGSTDFFREWKDYCKGFGEMSAEFWLGNDILNALTSMEPMSLRIDLRLGNDTAYAHYSNFSVGLEVNHYDINVSGYSGTAGDSMRYHNGCPFSTKDKGPSTKSVHCAKNYMGGWWYKNCYKANLNGVYATFSKDQGVVWIDWKGKDISLSFTEMKLRPASLSQVTLNIQGQNI